MDSNPVMKSRVVRVFLSSTFRDMQAERDELAKVVFPELRRTCRERQVEFVEVDLRWGVTEEQTQRGETLRLCLEEIERCRPYFICLLGERYGWTPGSVQLDVKADFPWLEQAQGCSMTEMEIIHGVLNNPSMAGRARFYFRDRRYATSRGSDYASESPQAAVQLAVLKERIRASGIPVVEDYTDPQSVAQRIGQDLRDAIEAEYPREEQIDPLDREAEQHQGFARSRERVYIWRVEYYDRLDRFAAGDGSPHALAVLGESGSGKSALLANWASRHQASHPDDFLFLHFTGSTPGSADNVSILQRVMGELKRCFEIKNALPEQAAELVKAFPDWLAAASMHMAKSDPVKGEKLSLLGQVKSIFRKPLTLEEARQRRIILVLDGLNQLEDQDRGTELGWLPVSFPANVAVIVSTLPGRSLEALQRRPHEELHVEPLTIAERKQLIEAYLALYRKQLDRARLERIASAEACANPLYLRVLLEELRLFGLQEQLADRIEHYLNSPTVADLYQKVLARMEEDYDPARRGVWQPPQERTGGMVGDALTLVWGARRGLAESELLDLLGSPPRAAWSPLFLALEDALVEQHGVLNFFHDYLRKAVEVRYLPNAAQRKNTRLRLAEYFDQRLRASGTAAPEGRALDELPWLWQQIGEWNCLYDLLADLNFFIALWQKDAYEVKTSWAVVEANSPLRKTAAYELVLQHPGEHQKIAWELATLLEATGNPQEALGLRTFLADAYQQSGDQENYATAIGNQALILQDRGDLDAALELMKEQERICRRLNNLGGLSISLGNQATVLHARGDLDGAMALYKNQERICRQLADIASLGVSLGNQALILQDHGDMDGAISLLKEKERICRQLGKLDELGITLGNQASIAYDRGDLDAALTLMKEQEQICRQLGDLDGLRVSLGNQGSILRDHGDLEKAMTLHKEVERICRQLGNLDGLKTSLVNQGSILQDRGDLDGAMALFKENERICRQLGTLDGLQTSLGKQSTIHYARGNLDAAMALLKEQERICHQLGNLDGLQIALGDQALILYTRGKMDEAMVLHKEKERICRQLGNLSGQGIALGNQAVILEARHDLNGALALMKEQERIFRQIGNLDGVGTALSNQANVLNARGENDEALVLLNEAENIWRQLGDLDGLQRILGGRASILEDRGDLDGALALYKEKERICRQLGNLDSLQKSLGNQGVILKKRGELDGALALYKEAERICRQVGNLDNLQIWLGNQAAVLRSRGDLDESLALYKEAERICRQLGNMDSLQKSLGNQALILRGRGDLEGALALQKEKERICRKLGSDEELARSLGNQANILYSRGDLDGSMALLNEQERIYRQLGDPGGLGSALGDQGLILRDRGDLDGAMALHKEKERICRQLGDMDELQIALGNQGTILHDRGDLDGATALYKEAEHICRQLGNLHNLHTWLGNQAAILRSCGNLDGAMSLQKEKERICRQLGNLEGLVRSIGNQALILGDKGKRAEAKALAMEALALAKRQRITSLENWLKGVVQQLSA